MTKRVKGLTDWVKIDGVSLEAPEASRAFIRTSHSGLSYLKDDKQD